MKRYRLELVCESGAGEPAETTGAVTSFAAVIASPTRRPARFIFT